MLKHDFWYDLPKELIAQEPCLPRDAARLLCLGRQDGSIRHQIFNQLPSLLYPGDLLVVNNSKVLPARLIGHKAETGAVCELLLLREERKDEWECLARPGKKLKPGIQVIFGDGTLVATILETRADGNKLVRFSYDTDTLYEKLDLQGALERRELPAPKLQPGPTVTVESTFAVSSVEDMIRRMAVQVDARNTALTIYTPVGQEGAYSQALLTEDTIDRFPDVDSMATRYYPDQGYFTVEIRYRDSARVMAYVEGKTDRLSAQDMALYEEAVRVHDSLVDSTMSQYERVKAFHDYLCDTVTYRKTGPESHTAYGALVNHAAVCQGYTQAMDLLCFLSGIDCEHIFGQATANGVTEYHAWVRVNIDGNWYNVDPTWDDQVTYISYDYFLVSDGHMDGHIWTAYPNWPVCPSDYPRP